MANRVGVGTSRWVVSGVAMALVLTAFPVPRAAASTADLEADLPQTTAKVQPQVIDGDTMLVSYSDPAENETYQRSADRGATWSPVTWATVCPNGSSHNFLTPENGVVVVTCGNYATSDNEPVEAFSLVTGQQLGASVTYDSSVDIIAGRGSRVLGVTYDTAGQHYWTQDLAAQPSTRIGLNDSPRLFALTSDGALGIDSIAINGQETSLLVLEVPSTAQSTVKQYPQGTVIDDLVVRGDLAFSTYTSADSKGVCFLDIAHPSVNDCLDLNSNDFSINLATSSGVLVTDWANDVTKWFPVSDGAWQAPITLAIGGDEFWRAREQLSGVPLLRLDSTHEQGLYQLQPDGGLAKIIDFPWRTTAEVRNLVMTPNAVIGGDAAQTWLRSVGAQLGAQSTLAPAAGSHGSAMASAGRWIVPTKEGPADQETFGADFYDQGEVVGHVTGMSHYWPTKASGPYLLVDYAEQPPAGTSPVAVNAVRLPDGTMQLADNAYDLFGSLALEAVPDPSCGDACDHDTGNYQIRDLSGATATKTVTMPTMPDHPAGTNADWQHLRQQIWGDWFGLTLEQCVGNIYTDCQRQVVIRNYRDPASADKRRAGDLVGLGDGVALVERSDDGTIDAWDFVHDQVVNLGSFWRDQGLALEGNRVAYPDYATGKLRVKTLGSGFAVSAPRSLGVVAAGSFTIGSSWSADIDVTKPLSAGALKVRDASGAVVRSVAVPATASGSLRGVTWDGKDDSGNYVPGGVYSFSLASAAADGSGTVRAIDGTDHALGTVSFTAPEVVVGTPVISGSMKVGEDLTVEPGTWGPTGVTLTIQWLRDGTPITDATSTTYTLGEADFGHKISVRVRGSVPGGVSGDATPVVTARSSTEVQIAAGKLTATPVPTITGRAVFGATVSATPGTWAPAPVSLSFQWLRDGKDIGGATSSSYLLSAADVGHLVSVRVTGAKSGYGAVASQSVAVPVAASTFTKVSAPTIRGTAKVGKALSARVSAWSPSASLRYQWLRNGKAIAKATKSSYKLTKSDKGKKISVKVTGSRPGFATVVKVSKAVGKVK